MPFIIPPKPAKRRPIRPQDLLVEYRDRNLVRRGSIPAQDLNLKFQPVFNGVGTWSITLPAEHRAVEFLRAPGSGIIITNHVTGKIEMSGPTSAPQKRITSSDVKGMVTISGVSDDCLLWQALAYPDPRVSADPSKQTKANDIRSGSAEALLRQYVAYNIANGALATPAIDWALPGRLGGFRSKLRLEQQRPVNLGTTVTKSPRFQNLGDLLREIALEGGGLGFRIVQVDDVLEFQVYQPTDRRDFIRLDVINGTLAEQEVLIAPPDVTRVVVAGQGVGTNRQLFAMTNADATAAEAQWGLIIEDFQDQRNTSDMAELISSGEGRLLEGGFTKVSTKAVPSNNQTMVFMEDFYLGDHCTVLIDGVETYSQITEAAIIADSTGVQIGVAIGSLEDFDPSSALKGTVEDNTRRLSQLEANAENDGSIAPGGRLSFNGETVTDWNKAVRAGFYRSDKGALNAPTDNILGGMVTISPDTVPDNGKVRVLQDISVLSTASADNQHLRYRRVLLVDESTGIVETAMSWTTVDTRPVADLMSGGRLSTDAAGGEGFNANNATTTGVWHVWSTYSNMPQASGGLWILRVVRARARIVQYAERVSDANDTTEVYRRTQSSTGTWSDWLIIDRSTTAYTPTVTGATVGNGTVWAEYSISRGRVSVRVRWSLGTTSSMSSDFRFSLPTAAAVGTLYEFGGGRAQLGSSMFDIVTLVANGVAYARFRNASGTFTTQQASTSANPAAWTAGDRVDVSFEYNLW